MGKWQTIDSAPKDGTEIVVLACGYEWGPCWDGDEKVWTAPKPHLAKWDPDGASWVDARGMFDGEIVGLAVTGLWLSAGGWFQPNEVTHWMPLPAPPANPEGASGG